MNALSTEGVGVEIRLTSADPGLAGLNNKRLFGSVEAGPIVTRTRSAVYFDSIDDALYHAGLNLRVERVGNQWSQILVGHDRLDGSGRIGVADDIAKPAPDLALLSKSACYKSDIKPLRRAALTPVFNSRTHVKARPLRAQDGTTMQIRFETATVGAAARTGDVGTVVIRLISGDFDTFYAFVEDYAATTGLVPWPHPVVDLGYRLKAAESREMEPQSYRHPRLPQKCSARIAYAAMLSACAVQVRHNWQVLLASDHIEGPHQMRVGLRRLRSVMKAFAKTVNDPLVDTLNDEARALGSVVGALRDADVLVEEIVADTQAAFPQETALIRLADVLERRRRGTRRQVRKALAGDRVNRFLVHLNAHIETVLAAFDAKGKKLPARSVASQALQKSWRRSKNWGQRIDELTTPERHEMRKSLKRLRYQVEGFQPLFPGDAVKAYIKTLKTLQNVFGYLNDVAMAEHLRDTPLPRSDNGDLQRAVGLILGWHTARAELEWAHVQEAWRTLAASDTFWT